MPPKLGLIAGAGGLPRQIVAQALAQGRQVFVIAFKGHTDPATVDGVPHQWFRLGAAGSTIKTMHREKIQDVVFAGAIRRPSFAELRPDFYTAKFYARIRLTALGDDGYLRAVTRLLEGEGFHVIGAHDIVKDLVVAHGVLGAIKPVDMHLSDIAHGFRVLAATGSLDIGQAVVVQQGVVLGVEAVEGTDQLIARCASMARGGSRPVLVKAAKPQQDMRLDMPTIGSKTIDQLAVSDFAGVAVEAGRTIVLDADALTQAADRQGIFVAAFDQNGWQNGWQNG